MDINYQFSPYIYAGSLTVKIWESQSDAPGAEVFSQTFPPPHNLPTTIAQAGFDRVPHIVRLLDDASNVLHFYEVLPVLKATVFDPIRFKIGDGGANTPAAGTDTYTNNLLQGLGDNDYEVSRNGYGELFPAGIHYNNNPNPGGFILKAGDKFNALEEFTIRRKQQLINSTVNDSVVGKQFAGFVDVAANTSYINSHLRKLIRMSGNAEYTFNALDAVPIGYVFCFQHYGPEGTGKINFLNAPLIKNNASVSFIDFSSYQEGGFVFDGADWNVWYLTPAVTVGPSAITPGTTIGWGTKNIGDIPGGNPLYEVIHNKNVTGDYIVFLSMKSNGNATLTDGSTLPADNSNTFAWAHHQTDKANRFIISLDERFADIQDCSICYLMIKV